MKQHREEQQFDATVRFANNAADSLSGGLQKYLEWDTHLSMHFGSRNRQTQEWINTKHAFVSDQP